MPEAAALPTTTGPQWSLPRGLIVLLAVASTVVAVGGAKAFAGVLGPVFLALMISIAVQPVQTWAQRHWPPWVGLVIALVVVNVALIGLAGLIVVTMAQLASELPQYSARLSDLLSGIRSALASAGVNADLVHRMLSELDLGKLVGFLDSFLGGMLGLVSNLVFVIALLMFMSVDGMTIGRRLALVQEMRPDIAAGLASFIYGTRRYLLVSTVFGFIVAVLDGAALWLLGVPLPLLWALVSFITNYIPNLGFIIGLIPPAFLALLSDGVWLMVWVIVVYWVINFILQAVIQPKFVGDAVGLSVTITFLSLTFWTWVLGPIGAVLAVPLTLLVKALLLDIDPATRWMDLLISTRSLKKSPKTGEAAAEGAGHS